VAKLRSIMAKTFDNRRFLVSEAFGILKNFIAWPIQVCIVILVFPIGNIIYFHRHAMGAESFMLDYFVL